MPVDSQANLEVLAEQRIRILAAKTDWPMMRAQGFLDGESFRRRGIRPSSYAQVGIDEYCLGFRAGYYGRSMDSSRLTVASFPARPADGYAVNQS